MKVEIFKKRHEHHTMRPTRQIALSFLAVILIGTILLSLPICNKSTPTTFLNNLFIKVYVINNLGYNFFFFV